MDYVIDGNNIHEEFVEFWEAIRLTLPPASQNSTIKALLAKTYGLAYIRGQIATYKEIRLSFYGPAPETAGMASEGLTPTERRENV